MVSHKNRNFCYDIMGKTLVPVCNVVTNVRDFVHDSLEEKENGKK